MREDDWGNLLGDTAAVTALLDRLLHHTHISKCGARTGRTKLQTDLPTDSPCDTLTQSPTAAPLVTGFEVSVTGPAHSCPPTPGHSTQSAEVGLCFEQAPLAQEEEVKG